MKITEFKPQADPAQLGVGSPAGGDLGGDMPAPTVVGIGGSPVDTTTPFAPGDVLTYDGTSWVPGPVDIDVSTIMASDLASRWEPMTNGDSGDPQVVFAGGDIIMVEVPT